MSASETTGARPYVFIWDGDGAEDTLTIIGPFLTHGVAAAWATRPAINIAEDPCWQTLNLRDPTRVRLLPPGAEADAAARELWPTEPLPPDASFVPQTMTELVRMYTSMLLNEINAPEVERADVIAFRLQDFAYQALNLPEYRRG